MKSPRHARPIVGASLVDAREYPSGAVKRRPYRVPDQGPDKGN